MKFRKSNFLLEIENLFIIILISFFFSDKIKLFLTSYFVCYLFIIFHELSHIIFASIFGKKIKKMKLSIAGVCVVFNDEELEIVKKIIVYIAGPLSNICLAFMFCKVQFIFEVNLFLAILNLVPVYPLDGYNIVNCIVDIFNNKKYLKNVEYTFLSLLFFVSFYILFKYLNPSLFIFFIYIMLIKYVTKNQVK